MGGVRTVLETGAREYARTPVLLALLALLPAYAVGLFGHIVPSDPTTVEVADTTVATTLRAVVATTMAPMSAALVTGVAGLFTMQSSQAADGRLVAAGYPARALVTGRLALLVGVALVATAAATGVLELVSPPAMPGAFLVAALLVALVYGAVGALVGLALGRLAGVYVLLFAPLVDLFLLQNPLAAETPALAVVLPSHHPMRAAMGAGIAGAAPADTLGAALGALCLVAGVTVTILYGVTRMPS